MRILLAPNAFKNSLDAISVAKAIGKGLHESKLKCTMEYFPVGDGGDGTAGLIIHKQKGRTINVEVCDALQRKITTSFGLIDDDKTAVIELANASGLRLLAQEQLNPLRATTFGTGELIQHALDKNVSRIILCIGGSATVDGGTGILQALGVKFLDDKNEALQYLPQRLNELTTVDINYLDKRVLKCELIILCDVKNKLLGENGAAKIFGPQKGATDEAVMQLENSLSIFRDVTLREKNVDMNNILHGGAAGGVAAGLFAYCNAKLVNGIDYFLSITEFEKALELANIVITGEGKIDEQTLEGKGPFGVAVKAKEKNIPVIGVAGSVPSETNETLQKYFDVLLSINNDVTDLNEAIKNTELNLIRTGRIIGEMLLTSLRTQ
jgi:glycerate kinase